MSPPRRYRCVDCQEPCSRGSERCKRCAARRATVAQGKVLVSGVPRDEDYRPTGVELARVARLLRHLRAVRRYRRRGLTVEETWSQHPLPVDQEYATVDRGRS
jgi:hypothetical protein